jgi:superoxide dismutase
MVTPLDSFMRKVREFLAEYDNLDEAYDNWRRFIPAYSRFYRSLTPAENKFIESTDRKSAEDRVWTYSHESAEILRDSLRDVLSKYEAAHTAHRDVQNFANLMRPGDAFLTANADSASQATLPPEITRQVASYLSGHKGTMKEQMNAMKKQASDTIGRGWMYGIGERKSANHVI